MKKMSETVVFFGSGPVAAQSLEKLIQNFNIEAVVTKPQPSHHKEAFPVITIAEKHSVPIMVASTRHELDALMRASQFRSRVAVLIDYGIIVSQGVIDSFPLGIINSHFSLLPQWRGADPITFSILSGQKETGVSLMLLVAAMDEGPLLAQAPFGLPTHITTPELTEALIGLSSQTLVTALPDYVAGTLKPFAQDTAQTPTYSRKLTKADGLLDFTKPAERLEREVRAYIQWPGSHMTLGDKEIIVTKAHVGLTGEMRPTRSPSIFITGQKEIAIRTAQDFFVIDALKPAGKRAMTVQAFLAGYAKYL